MSSEEDIEPGFDEQASQQLNELIENDDNIATLKENLANAETEKANLLKKLKKQCLSSISITELVEQVLENFDETGEYMGFEDTHVQIIHNRISEDSEDLVNTLEKMITKFLTSSDNFSPIYRRRYNLHFLAMLYQLLQVEEVPEQVKIFFASVLNNLCDYEHDWSEVTPTEVDVLQEVSETFDDVPEQVTNLLRHIVPSLAK